MVELVAGPADLAVSGRDVNHGRVSEYLHTGSGTGTTRMGHGRQRRDDEGAQRVSLVLHARRSRR